MSTTKPHSNIEDIFQLSPLQEVMLVETLNAPAGAVYLDHLVFEVRAKGGLSTPEFLSAVQETVRRHSALRTAFAWTLRDKPQQVVLRRLRVTVDEQHWRDIPADLHEARLNAYLAQDREKGYDLSRPPLFRLALLRRDQDSCYVVLSYHHIILDGWSTAIVFDEVFRLYEARLQGRPVVLPDVRSYRGYIEWTRRHDRGMAEAFWRQQLSGFVTPTTLWNGDTGLDDAANNTAVRELQDALPAKVTADLQSAVRSAGLTLSTVVQAAWAIALSRAANESDVLFGVVVSGRPPELTGMESIVGLFTNTLPVRVRVPASGSTIAWLKELQNQDFERYRYAWTPLGDIQKWSDIPAGQPMLQTVVIVQNYGRSAAGGLSAASSIDVRAREHDFRNTFPLTLMAVPGSELLLRLRYDPRRLGGTTIQRLGRHLDCILRCIADSLSHPVSVVAALPESEAGQVLLEWNDSGTLEPSNTRFAQLFEEQVKCAPDRIAATFEGAPISYRELNERADLIANSLRSAVTAAESRIALLAPRGVHYLAGMVAILKTDYAFVPVDPNYPSQRVLQLLKESGAHIVLAEDSDMPRWENLIASEGVACRVLPLDVAEAGIALRPAPAAGNTDSLAYVLFTSGSTGTPKGAMITHGGMVNHLLAKVNALHLTETDVVAQNASQTFDISIWQFLSALLVGGRIHIVDDRIAHDPAGLLQEIVRAGITVLEIVPSMLRSMLEQIEGDRPCQPDLGTLRWLLATGEELTVELSRRWFETSPEVPLVNAYGPTECSDDVTHAVLRSALPFRQRVPIGRPVDNTQIYIFNHWLEPCGIGVAGELFAGGAGVGRGYLNDPAKTAEQYVPDPVASQPGRRLFRTGDMARRLNDGTIEFLGRRDQQIKIRGHRIELGEIESALERHSRVRSCAVVAKRDSTGREKLVAYIVLEYAGNTAERPNDRSSLEQWQTVFDDVYGQAQWQHDSAINLGLWVNSYTGLPFSQAEVEECVQDSADRILESSCSAILEVGCGTGLLLSRLAPHCDYYCGTDFSPAALEALRDRTQAALGADAGKVELRHAAADDFSGFGSRRFDVVVLNEIVQYFPDSDYLVHVIEQAVESVRDGGTIFIGDLRNLHLLDIFHGSVQMLQASPDDSIDDVRQRIIARKEREKELVVAPEFFMALQYRIPRIQSVEVLPKSGRAANEFAKFRYHVVFHVGSESGAAVEVPSLEWESQGWDISGFESWLVKSCPPVLRLKSLTNARVEDDVRACRLIWESSGLKGMRQLQEVLKEDSPSSGIAPDAIVETIRGCGYDAVACWDDTDQTGRFDVVLSRKAGEARRLATRARGLRLKSGQQYTNRPHTTIDSTAAILEIQSALRESLPEHMIPSDFIPMLALPLSPNGKLDRRALAAIEDSTSIPAPAATRTPLDDLALSLWAEVLGRDAITLDTNFFEAGGHSLMATQVVSRIRRSLGYQLPIQSLFEAPTPASFAKVLDSQLRKSQGLEALPPIERSESAGPVELSFQQQRLWVTYEMEADAAAYNLPSAVRIEGPLNPDALEAAVGEILRRHEGLRTTFRQQDGGLVSVHSEWSRWMSRPVDLTAFPEDRKQRVVERLAHEEAVRPFDLHNGPLLRGRLVKLDSRTHVFLITMHHIVSDAWSVTIFVRELVALYKAFVDGKPSELPELPIQYRDYSAWQRKCFAGERLQQQLSYWKTQLAGLPPRIPLAPRMPAPIASAPASRTDMFQIPRSVSMGLAQLCRQENVTMFMAVVAVVNMLLYRTNGLPDVLVGADIANRNFSETEKLIGFFVNLLVLRTDLSGRPSFRSVLARTRDVALNAYARQDLPFDTLTRELRLQHGRIDAPLFDVLVVFQNAPRSSWVLPDLTWRSLDFDYAAAARFDLALFIEETSEGLVGGWRYRTSAYDEATLAKLGRRFETLIQRAVETPDGCIDELEWSDAAEQHMRASLQRSSAERFQRARQPATP